VITFIREKDTGKQIKSDLFLVFWVITIWTRHAFISRLRT